MNTLRSSPFEELESQAVGTRFFVVCVFDPETGLLFKGSIGITPEGQDEWRSYSAASGQDYDQVLPWVAAGRILNMVWGGKPPDGFEVRSIEEVSREDLAQRIRESEARKMTQAD